MTWAFPSARRAVRQPDAWAGWLHLPRTRLGWAVLAALASIAMASLVIRLHVATGLDPFEDGYQHWWIASNLAETGTFWDRHSRMTQGNWLPLYDFLAAGVLLIAGLHNLPALKAVNVLLSLGTVGVTFVLGRRHGVPVALLAASLLAFNPIDIAISGYAVADPLGTLAIYVAIFALSSAWLRRRTAGVLASLALLIAVATRYEAWVLAPMVFAYGYAIGFPRLRRKDLVVIFAPAAVFVALWWAWTSQWGFLPSIIIQQTSTDVRYKVELGIQPAVDAVLQRYWAIVLTYILPLAALGGAYAVYRARRDLFAWLVLLIWGLVSLYVALRFGQPSPRYILVSFPALALLAARGIVDLHARLARPLLKGMKRHVPRVARHAVALAVAGALLVPMALQVDEALLRPDTPIGFWMQPMERAGRWLSAQPQVPDRILLSESPIAAYYSGWPASRMLGARWLPDDRDAALAYLHDAAAYVVYMGVPYYTLRMLFPELHAGQTVAIGNVLFEMVYDANGAEAPTGAHLVFVYRVVPQ